MFLKSLRIENQDGLIRHIPFHAGLNLIVDETPSDSQHNTGNNVGKTTVLKLIDICLGADPRRVYTDLENAKSEYTEVKQFLIETQVLVTLTLCESFDVPSERDLIIERNFLPRKNLVRRINGRNYTQEGFEEFLTNHLFPDHYGRKPTFAQIISHNIRYKEPSVSNTLKTLHQMTKDDEYEALYLFLLGCSFTDGERKQQLLAKLRSETTFKRQLESKQTKSAYRLSLALLMDEITELEAKRASFKQTSDVDVRIQRIAEIKYRKGVVASELSKVRLRRDLVREAVHEVSAQKSHIDIAELKKLYGEVSERFGSLTKSFEELVSFHNRMVDEKVRYIAKDLPHLEVQISAKQNELHALNRSESENIVEITETGTLEEIEAIVVRLNERHRMRGEFETVIEQISAVDDSILGIRSELAELDRSLFSKDATWAIEAQLAKFNRHFASVSDELYGEKYALKVDRVTNAKTSQQVYQFTCFNTNFSSGKKQGEITCFDIAYTLFADEEGIPCYHFLLNDKKELMHDNQLQRIGKLVVSKSNHVQFVASILRDKLPPELNEEKYLVVKLSQDDKLFRIESGGAPLTSIDSES
ncbi:MULTISPECIES: DUF2326 domain-containing protein [Delftia]|uniref:DUF2326 domain-containing protein n=1 Tax=Delftia tsuruhatensis TaxID=180282 RepID=A0ABN4SHD2_9BURK|nr:MULTISPECIES: DUF2326 domain-containing protein [Delftia]AOV02145.1 hypothetical protein BI380_12765 [Delftia tsuruhatensis]MBK0115340.1 DUF2326 domain-containing protein [Delftia sp. S65]MBK0119803.1 DUF2326 domain-containing protein [Delftia sp. S67]MBK0132009.1 DUF2326 domain-containing protein [Delftia sp. S66]